MSHLYRHFDTSNKLYLEIAISCKFINWHTTAWCITDARGLKVIKNQTKGGRIFLFYRITVQYKTFSFLGFENDLIKPTELESFFSTVLQFNTKHFGFYDLKTISGMWASLLSMQAWIRFWKLARTLRSVSGEFGSIFCQMESIKSSIFSYKRNTWAFRNRQTCQEISYVFALTTCSFLHIYSLTTW